MGPVLSSQVESSLAVTAGVEDKKNGWVHNEDYEPKMFEKLEWGGAQKQLAGFHKGHAAWSQKD